MDIHSSHLLIKFYVELELVVEPLCLHILSFINLTGSKNVKRMNTNLLGFTFRNSQLNHTTWITTHYMNRNCSLNDDKLSSL